jgi:hypothetical protein
VKNTVIPFNPPYPDRGTPVLPPEPMRPGRPRGREAVKPCRLMKAVDQASADPPMRVNFEINPRPAVVARL